MHPHSMDASKKCELNLLYLMAEYITYELSLISNGLQQTIDGDMQAEIWEGSKFHILLHGIVKIKIYIYVDCWIAIQQIKIT